MEGIGVDRVTGMYGKHAMVDSVMRIRDQEAVDMAYYLKDHEGLLVGPSAALNVVGAVKTAKKLGPGHTVVCVICDTGTFYLSKLYNPDWLKDQGLTPT